MLRLLGAALLAFWLGAGSAHGEETRAPKPWRDGATPPLALKDLDGRARTLAEYRGKTLLVNFWATWCEPCRAELPSIERLGERLRGRGFEVVAVNVGEGEARVRQFLEESMVELPVLLDRDSEALKAWKVRGLPTTFLLDAQGRIRYWLVGEYDWSQQSVVDLVRSLPAR